MTKPRRNIATCFDLPRRIRRRCANWASFISTKDKFRRPIRAQEIRGTAAGRSGNTTQAWPELSSPSVIITQARDAAVQVLEKQPGQEQALLLLVDASRTPDDIEDARKLVQSLIGKKIRTAPDIIWHWECLICGKTTRRARKANSKPLLIWTPKSSEAYAALANLILEPQRSQRSRPSFQNCCRSRPTSDHRCGYDMRISCLKLELTPEAKKILEEISRKLPDYLPPRVFLMKMACAEHQDEDCAARVQNILAQDPLNYDALFQDGILKPSER